MYIELMMMYIILIKVFYVGALIKLVLLRIFVAYFVCSNAVSSLVWKKTKKINKKTQPEWAKAELRF